MLADSFRQLAAQDGNRPRQAWADVFAARVALLRGDAATARQHLDGARELAGETRDGFLVTMVPGLLALTLIHLDEADAARREAELALEHLSGAWSTNFSTREAYLATASAFRMLGDSHGERQTVAELIRFAWLFPMAAPITRCYRTLLNGRTPSRRRQLALLRQVARCGAVPDEILLRQCRQPETDARLTDLCTRLGLPAHRIY